MNNQFLENELKKILGNNIKIINSHSISGGCINDTFQIELNDKQKYFVKKNNSNITNLFRAELEGLNSLRKSECITIPKPLTFIDNGNFQFLILEYIETENKKIKFWDDFGKKLALLHRDSKSDNFGFHIDNHIGLTDQINTRTNSWINFF